MSIYKTYSEDEMDNLLSQFLISNWSYSKLSQFARNEKAFEMIHIYGQYSKSSATTIAGQAYHYALDRYFNAKMRGEDFDIVSLEMLAFKFIEEVQAYKWKVQKTTPTVEECKQKALKVTTALIKNFFSEIGTYLDDIEQVLYVEIYCEEFLTINGVDIPMPCKAKIDLVVKTKAGKIAIIDHKSKAAFSDEQALRLSIGVQAITYSSCYEAMFGEEVNEVWFIENKYSQNKGGTPQLAPFKIELSDDVKRLYEALLYEPLKRMLEAVNNPDYVYLINESDTLQDKAEIYDFWAKTMIAEVDDFNVDPKKKDLVKKRLRKIRDASIASINPKVIKNFRQNAASFIQYDLSNSDMTAQQKIEHVLKVRGAIVSVAHMFNGYSSDTYLLEASAGVKLSSIASYRLDIANALNVSNVRIPKELTVYEGKAYLPVDFSKERDRDLFFEPADLVGMKLPLGKDNYGNVITWDLDNHTTPNTLICGSAGSGKSVCIKSTLEYAILAGVNDIVILDPKFEFTDYSLKKGIKVYNEILDIENEMIRLVAEMQQKIKSKNTSKTLVIFDEFADAVSQSRSGTKLNVYDDVVTGHYANGMPKMKTQVVDTIKPLEENLRMLLQKGRSSGYRVLAGTQRASVKVITGDAKVNFANLISFRVPKAADSMVVLDEAGAEALSGRGDGLMKSPEHKDIVRFQAYYCK